VVYGGFAGDEPIYDGHVSSLGWRGGEGRRVGEGKGERVGEWEGEGGKEGKKREREMEERRRER
jgi:hypothetical protein